MLDVLAIGAANTDFFFHVKKLPSLDEEVNAYSIDKALGGSAANFAVGCAKLNLKAGFLGCVGLDREGNELMENFEKEHVNAAGVKRVDAKTGRFVSFVDESGNKAMAVFIGANNLLSPEMVSKGIIENARLVHITSLSSENAFNALLKAKGLALKSNVPVSLDPGTILAERGLDGLHSLLEGIDFVFLNRKSLGKMAGSDSVKKGCKALSGLVKNVVVTLGGSGCFVHSGGKGFAVPAIKAKAVDTTGAGDAFAAAFVYGILKGYQLGECAFAANLAAGNSIQGQGARCSQVSEAALLKELEKKKRY